MIAMSPEAIVDELVYRNYAFNRRRSPHIAPAAYRLIYNQVDELEARFQAEEALRAEFATIIEVQP